MNEEQRTQWQAGWSRNHVGDFTVMRRIRGNPLSGRRMYEAFNRRTQHPALVVSSTAAARQVEQPWEARVVSTPHGLVLELEPESASRVDVSAVVAGLELAVQALSVVRPDSFARTALHSALSWGHWRAPARLRRSAKRAALVLVAAVLLMLAAYASSRARGVVNATSATPEATAPAATRTTPAAGEGVARGALVQAALDLEDCARSWSKACVGPQARAMMATHSAEPTSHVRAEEEGTHAGRSGNGGAR